jgi:hypothetical protein
MKACFELLNAGTSSLAGVYPAGLPATAASSTSAAINLAQTPGVFAMHA